MRLILNWLAAAVVILIAAFLLPGVSVDGLVAALILAVVLGAINGFIRPILVLLTLPLTILTLGLFLFILNALLIQLAAAIVPGFHVASLWSAMLFSIVLSIISAVLYQMSSPPPPASSSLPR